jgi:hypothetical protein
MKVMSLCARNGRGRKGEKTAAREDGWRFDEAVGNVTIAYDA